MVQHIIIQQRITKEIQKMSKIICENEIENVTFKLSSNDDKKQYQQLFVEHDENWEVLDNINW